MLLLHVGAELVLVRICEGKYDDQRNEQKDDESHGLGVVGMCRVVIGWLAGGVVLESTRFNSKGPGLVFGILIHSPVSACPQRRRVSSMRSSFSAGNSRNWSRPRCFIKTVCFAAVRSPFEGKRRCLEAGVKEFTPPKYQKVEGLARSDLRYAARNEGFGVQQGRRAEIECLACLR